MTSCGADPLRYDLQWVNGICYRVHPKASAVRPRKSPVSKPNRMAGGIDDTSDDYDDELPCQPGRNDAAEVAEGEEKFSMSLRVPDRYLSRICGQQHSRRKELETTTKTTIEIPKKGSAGPVVVTGDDESRVQFCIEKIQNLVMDFRSTDTFTHFVSIPLNYTTVQRNLAEFKTLLLQSQISLSGPEVTEKMFIKERKLHLTVCCLCLFDKNEEAQAVEILESCAEFLQGPVGSEPFNIEIRGLEIMNDAPSEVNVLYAKVLEKDCNDAGRLQILCDSIAERFRQSGFMVNRLASSRERIKLHMTVINSKFAEDPGAVDDPNQSTTQRTKAGRDSNRKSKSTFDATRILKDFGDAQFGIVELNRVELNAIALTEPGTGYYRKLSQLRLPTSSRT